MSQLQEYFYVTPSNDKMSAEIYCNSPYDDQPINEAEIIEFLHEQKIIYGIDREIVKLIVSVLPSENFPLTIAKGTPPIDGKDGEIFYESNFSSEVVKTPDWNFRNVMSIPTVRMGEKIATITLPTEGKDGTDIFGRVVRARTGKRVSIRAGKNVVFQEKNLSFYAAIEGQVSVSQRAITVHTVFEVRETVSMKTGNLDFVGSIVIHGDVPTGFSVKADGDIKIFGMVEGAEVIAKGSVFISEGFAGLKKGKIQAGENVHIGYINQGVVHAGDSIDVENSILHSECIAKNELFCRHGNIIGGSLSVGRIIEAKDIGNRMSTKTIISLGTDKKAAEEETKLREEKAKLEIMLSQLKTIGKKLESQIHTNDSKLRITLLRQRNSERQIVEKIEEIKTKLFEMNTFLGNEEDAELIVRNYIYPNTIIEFGKYKRKINSERRQIKVKLEQNEIVIMQQND